MNSNIGLFCRCPSVDFLLIISTLHLLHSSHVSFKKVSSSWTSLSKGGKVIIQLKLIGMKRFDNKGKLDISLLICAVLANNDFIKSDGV